MNEIIQKFRKWFETDVSESIKPIIKEWLLITEDAYTKEELESCYNDAKLTEGSNISNTYLDYILMSDPSLHVEMDFDNNTYSIKIQDQLGIRMKYIVTSLDDFITYWNRIVVEYYGQDAHLPEIPRLFI